MIHRTLLVAILFLGWAAAALADLKPDEVAVLATQGNRESEALAKYYAKVRSIPAENICLVDVPREETLPRDMWQWGVRPEIQKWLKEKDPDRKIRCLVTTWGIPLRIGKAESNVDTKKYEAFLAGERTNRIKLLGSIRDALDRIAPAGELSREDVPPAAGKAAAGDAPVDAAAPLFSSTADGADDKAPKNTAIPIDPAANQLAAGPAEPKSEIDEVRGALEDALQDAQVRIAKLPVGDQRVRSQVQLQQLATAAGGANVLLQGINQRLTGAVEPDPALKTEFDVLRGRAVAMNEIKSLLDQTAPSIDRDALELAIMERLTGLIGTVEWLDTQLGVAKQNETGAAFDSELSLVMWPDDYQLLRWQPNYLRPGFDNSQLSKAFRTLMVARIDGPSLALAKGLIDTAMKVEAEGLRGKVYIDNRGIAKLTDPEAAPGSYADFDRSLLMTAKGIDELTDMEVVVEATPQLFQAGKCPGAALYCGWYSLGKYVDAFEWQPGAVAYHLASSEATTLRDPASQVWCKKMLEDGVCATIGPVNEPYLAAFPRPNEFFAMLLQGDLTLVECYYRSQPFNSWMMTLIGDPLYRPFKYRANLKASDNAPGISTRADSSEELRESARATSR